MMRRETAIKMLNVDTVNDASIARFEREVQITCQLNHPNTIAIYDYGRTPEGVFYYAMEYLDGIDLQTLAKEYGPQSEQRVIHILLQVCGSLYEAHSQGLVHRDIKPANIMLNRRGCEPDVVKVLDFGLVKAIDDEHQANMTSAGSLTGTPLYMSPEAIQAPMSVDARSDIYAVGAVGYFLLTGEPVFEAASLVELCQKHVDETPIPPSGRFATDVSSELEDAILACLEKSRAKRPQTARDLAQLLAKCRTSTNPWSIDDGDAWWGRHERGDPAPAVPEANTTEVTLDRTIDE
jgi:serine/threonine protein kinase